MRKPRAAVAERASRFRSGDHTVAAFFFSPRVRGDALSVACCDARSEAGASAFAAIAAGTGIEALDSQSSVRPRPTASCGLRSAGAQETAAAHAAEGSARHGWRGEPLRGGRLQARRRKLHALDVDREAALHDRYLALERQ